jgi:hypothetical protein
MPPVGFGFSILMNLFVLMWENLVQHMGTDSNIIWRMRFVRWTTKATYTCSQYVILIAFPLHQRLRECASKLCYRHIACLFQHSSLRPKQSFILRNFSDWIIIWWLWPHSAEMNQWNFHFWDVFKNIVYSNLWQLVLVCSRISNVWPYLLPFCTYVFKYFGMLHQICANFPTNLGATQISSNWEGDIKQATHWGHTNISRHPT